MWFNVAEETKYIFCIFLEDMNFWNKYHVSKKKDKILGAAFFKVFSKTTYKLVELKNICLSNSFTVFYLHKKKYLTQHHKSVFANSWTTAQDTPKMLIVYY
jgi:hypothetical protein